MRNRDEKGNFKVVGWTNDEMASMTRTTALATKTGFWEAKSSSNLASLYFSLHPTDCFSYVCSSFPNAMSQSEKCRAERGPD